MKEMQGKNVAATTPGNMGAAVNNQFGGGVGVPGQPAPQDMRLAQQEMLKRAMMHMQQAGQKRQPMQGQGGSQGLQNAWSSMGDPNQFIQEQMQKQMMLRAMQKKMKDEMQIKMAGSPPGVNPVVNKGSPVEEDFRMGGNPYMG